ncbi:aldehyde dehydrogenase family protein [Mesorhizobium sp. M0830]
MAKPSELTLGTTLQLAKILEEAGLPKGVSTSLPAMAIR